MTTVLNFKGKVALVGAGKGGSAFLSVLINEPTIDLIGISDVNPAAPGLSIAAQSGISVTTDFRELLRKKPDIVINVTGSSGIQAELLKNKTEHTEIIDGKSAKLIWGLLKKHQDAKTEVKNLLNETKELYHIGVSLLSADKMEEVLDSLLTEACRNLGVPAGSIALYDEKTDLLTLKASRGFSLPFSSVVQWKVRDGGMTDHILSKRIPTVISNVDENAFIDNKVLIREGIKSLIAIPLFANERTVGILYLDDFKPREWSEREIEFATLLGIQAAYAIEKFSLIERISETRTYLKNVLDNSADIIITTDTEGRIVEFNTGASKILGYKKSEVQGMMVQDLWVYPEKRPELLRKLDKEGSLSNHETQLRTKDGRVIDISLTLSHIKNGDSRIHGTVGISKDITEKKRLEKAIEERNLALQDMNEKLEQRVRERTRELENANKELERTNKLKSQFIATMSHELRTPLNSILGFSDLLLMGEVMGDPLTEKQKDFVGNIYNSGSHLLQLINNILDIAKIEAGRMELHYDNFSVHAIIKEVESVIRPLSEKRRQTLTLQISEDIPIITADKIKLKQVLYNLLSNAVKFTPDSGSITVSAIQVKQSEAEGQGPESIYYGLGTDFVEISVADTGIGIKKDDLERIFSEFEQVESTLSRRYEGTGLGLTLTKRLVELHGGEIKVESEIGKGSKFTIIIPLPRIPSMQKTAQRPARMQETHDIVPTKRKGPAPLILIVEDDRPTSEILTLYLTQEGYRVAHAYDGDAAINKARSLMPFAILLDVMLPGKDGWEILQELKSDHELKDIPVIMSSIIDNKELGFALGASDYLVKPIDRSILMDKVREINIPAAKKGRPANILCIDDQEDVLKLLASIFEPAGYSVMTASSGMEGVSKALQHRPDFIILDLMMPEMDGFDVVQALKANNTTADIPIIILTAKDLTMDDRFRLTGKVENYMQKKQFTKEDFLMSIKDLEATYPVKAGLLDEVSGLFDHCYFTIRTAQEITRAKRYKDSLAVIVIDIDNFTGYINTYGAHSSNLVIKRAANFIRNTIRGCDTVVRYGMDEFALILPNALKKDAAVVAARCLDYFEQNFPIGEKETHRKKLTASASVISYPEDASSPEEIVLKARQALKKAKERGGGQVEIYGQKV